jgi:hypothetical protein
MNSELERMWKGATSVKFMEEPRNMPGAIMEYHETPVMITDLPASFRT